MQRREFNQALIAGALSALSVADLPASDRRSFASNTPHSLSKMPAVGMGTWITFDVYNDAGKRNCLEVLRTFLKLGGRVVDSSPMYGAAQSVLGYCHDALQQSHPDLAAKLYAATKVWISGRQRGIDQMDYAEQLWGDLQFDLMQIHNMTDWHTHLETLTAWKAEGRIRSIGLTTSHGRRENGMVLALQAGGFDSVQFSYNLLDRKAENRLLPAAREMGCDVIINRPFQTGGLFRHVRGKALPPIAAEYGCRNWAQYFLKWVISHPDVTCAIPATSQVSHMQENMGALQGELPDSQGRAAMLKAFENI